MVTEVVERSAWGWTPETITLGVYALALCLAIGRQVAVWLDGWRSYSRGRIIWKPSSVDGGA